MRKILLATSALVAFAGAAQAADSPITVNVGGYVDFRAAQFSEEMNNNTANQATNKRRDHDFETEFRLNVSAEGKAANGIEYGGLISLWNGASLNEFNDSGNILSGGGDSVVADQAYVWMSGAWGKVLLGDEHGASDLFVYAPTVGEGQIDGTYTDFTDQTTLVRMMPTFIDNTENSTKITYYTPKVGNANHKLQLGASFSPNYIDKGQNVIKYRNTGPAYQDYVEASAQYTGNFAPVSTVVSATMATANANKYSPNADNLPLTDGLRLRDFTSWGVGAQAMYAGFTLGGSYVDAGRYGTFEGGDAGFQNKDQHVWTAGLKYEFDKVALAVNGMRGEGYNNAFQVLGTNPTGETHNVNYVKDFSAVGLGATYTWFPGLTTAADVVLFSQERADRTGGVNVQDNDGHVLMLSQKITF